MKLSRAAVLSTILALLGTHLVTAAVPESEKAALEALYAATHGESWTVNDGWLEADDPCDWYGVTCDASHLHVTELRLRQNNLVGVLPGEIGDLTALTSLDLSYNRIGGQLPPEIGSLVSLQYLDAGENHLVGEIPPNIGELAQLRGLFLEWNHLEGPIPPGLGDLAQLTDLSLAANRLTGELPTTLLNLGNLHWVLINENGLHTGDPVLAAFLTAHQYPLVTEPWDERQTLPPTGAGVDGPLTVTDVRPTSVSLAWTPDTFLDQSSHYEVVASSSASGPWSRVPSTSEGRAAGETSGTVVGQLRPGSTSYLAVRTVTFPHLPRDGDLVGNELNAVVSELSPPVKVTTPAVVTLYVAEDGDDANDCSSWSSSCATLAAALAKGSPGSVVEIGSGTFEAGATVTSDVTLRGRGAWATTLDVTGTYGGVSAAAGVRLTLQGVTLTGATPAESALVSADSGAIVWVVECEVVGGPGAGIFVVNADLMVERSLVADNVGTGVVSWGSWGSSSGSVSIVNSTIGGNQGMGGSATGGVYTEGPATLIGSSVLFNSNGQGLEGIVSSGPSARLAFSIVGGHPGANCSGTRSLGGNLADDASCNLSTELADAVTGDVQVVGLTDNGGPVRTFALQATSPAVDVQIASRVPAIDARRLARPQGPWPDSGAYERLLGGTFGDVPPEYWAERYIEGLATAGVTAGCGGGSYCPEDPVSRAQMAVFLLRAEHGPSWAPAAPSGIFTDVPVDYWAAAWIEALATEGITAGCGGGAYCPEADVSRAQMAVFLLKTEHGALWTPPDPAGVFGDVPTDYWAAAWIEALAGEGITAGCGGGDFCPEDPVDRAQMAVFIDKAFHIPR